MQFNIDSIVNKMIHHLASNFIGHNNIMLCKSNFKNDLRISAIQCKQSTKENNQVFLFISIMKKIIIHLFILITFILFVLIVLFVGKKYIFI